MSGLKPIEVSNGRKLRTFLLAHHIGGPGRLTLSPPNFTVTEVLSSLHSLGKLPKQVMRLEVKHAGTFTTHIAQPA